MYVSKYVYLKWHQKVRVLAPFLDFFPPPLSVGFAAEPPNHILGGPPHHTIREEPEHIDINVFVSHFSFLAFLPACRRTTLPSCVSPHCHVDYWLTRLICSFASQIYFKRPFVVILLNFWNMALLKKTPRSRQSRTGLSLSASHYLESIQKPLQPAANSHAIQTNRQHQNELKLYSNVIS